MEEQQRHLRRVVGAGGDVQRRAVRVVQRVGVGTALEQHARGLEVLLPQRPVQRRLAARHVARLEIGAGGEQQTQLLVVAAVGHPVQRRVLGLAARVDVDAALDQQLHAVARAVARRHHESREALSIDAVDVVDVAQRVEQLLYIAALGRRAALLDRIGRRPVAQRCRNLRERRKRRRWLWRRLRWRRGAGRWRLAMLPPATTGRLFR
jgi:hypothetical protein